MNPPPADHFPGFAADERDRRRIADTAIPIAGRVIIACNWENLWSWAVDFAAAIEDPQHRSNALKCYAARQEWWADAIEILTPEFEAAEGDQ